MRTQITETSIKLWLSADDTDNWAHTPGTAWPGSTLEGKRLFVEFDSNGLCDLRINGRAQWMPHYTEVNAITSDFLRDKLPEDHPLYHITVGRFTNTQKGR
jgi:hypothetical protein